MKHSKDRGSIYITVMIILVVILMLLSMLVGITSRDVRTSNLYSEGIKASYLAHSGIALGISDALEMDLEDPENRTSVSDSEANPFSQYLARHRVEWQINYDIDEDTYTILSEGSYQYSDKITVKRMLEVVVRVEDDKVEVVSWKQKYD